MKSGQTNYETLKPTDKQSKREKFKNIAIEISEQGNLKTALNMFEQVEN